MDRYHIKVLYGGTYQEYVEEAAHVKFDNSYIFLHGTDGNLTKVFPSGRTIITKIVYEETDI
jgi:hypothetical protein